jgi:hypothetical protein
MTLKVAKQGIKLYPAENIAFLYSCMCVPLTAISEQGIHTPQFISKYLA